MSKHTLSPAPLPPSKRLHTRSMLESHPPTAPRSSFDTVLYDEIILVIFSYLSWTDLCAIQCTNKNWARLALDNQLWKSLYLAEYGRARLRGVRGFIGRGDGREVKPLPGRVKAEEVKDWKWMFRISSNWRTGRCSVEHFDTGVERASSAISSQSKVVEDQTFVVLAGDITIIASSLPSSFPSISLISPRHTTHVLKCPSSRLGVTTQITALALDQSPPSCGQHSRVICFLSTGEFCLFSINHHTPSSSSRLLTYVPSSKTARTSPIIQAVYHHPLLVTLSQSFHLSLYDLSSNTVAHTQTLTSFTSYPPSSLVLSHLPPRHTNSFSQLIISNGENSRMEVSATRTARAVDVPQGWVDEQKLRAMREQWARKVSRVADTQTDGKDILLAFVTVFLLAVPVHVVEFALR
ncbi:hypothetical protein A0H81_13471 [Grifola frondosa]|uniref:F-box domain-containing protein n=1 Tax=Grifola frondosa TaxID=5627 RepID=A0A1C7LPC7_GRIFR|nr:hypothetical protein A0H81_13471 [Grifola frondosa]